MLEIKNLSVFYGDAQSLKEVSLEVAQGSIVALVGANGAGKSTTLSTIAGLLKPRHGSITFMGQSLVGMQTKDIVELGISMVPEGRWIFSKMTVFENLELGAYTPRARKGKTNSLDRVLALFPDLKPRLHDPAMVLSGGQQQMLAIGRALMSEPKLIMLDEPSLGLAPLVVEIMFEVFKTLHSQGVTILLVEQNIQKSLELAHMGYVIKTGSISLSGTGTELLNDEGVCRAFLAHLFEKSKTNQSFFIFFMAP